MIHEDPDDLGYWTESAFPDDWNPRIRPWLPPHYTLSMCNALLSDQEQNAIESAARLAATGQEDDAELMRAWGGYDRIWRQASRVSRFLPPTGKL